MTSGLRCEPVPQISGEIRVPGDKSISHRALMLGAIAEGETRITGFLQSADCLATMNALQELGVDIHADTDTDIVTVAGRGVAGLQPPGAALDLGNSGTSMRLMAGLLAGQDFECELTGDASLSYPL